MNVATNQDRRSYKIPLFVLNTPKERTESGQTFFSIFWDTGYDLRAHSGRATNCVQVYQRLFFAGPTILNTTNELFSPMASIWEKYD